MISIILGVVLRLAALIAAIPTVAWVLTLPRDQISWVAALVCVCAMPAVLFGGLRRMDWHLQSRRSGRGASALQIPTAKAASRAATQNFQLERRARHEAAHAVVAVRLGQTVTSADVLVRDSGVGGRVVTDWMSSADELASTTYRSMQISLAGQICDLDGGFHDGGSQTDMQAAIAEALTILSTGQRPDEFTGELTLEELITSARASAAEILSEMADAVDRVADALMKNRTLNRAEIAALVNGAALSPGE